MFGGNIEKVEPCVVGGAEDVFMEAGGIMEGGSIEGRFAILSAGIVGGGGAAPPSALMELRRDT